MKTGEFGMRDLFDLFNREFSASSAAPGRCIECGRSTTFTLDLGSGEEHVCEHCAADFSEAMLAEALR